MTRRQVLVVYYSQSGQLREILDAMVGPLMAAEDVALSWHEIRPVTPFPLPWTIQGFFDVFPETVLLRPCALEPAGEALRRRYDLVLLGCQPWFLSPSRPLSSFLQSEGAVVLQDTPVLTIFGCRNTWIGAYEDTARAVSAAGGRMVGNIVLQDHHANLASVLSTLRWMRTGRKHRSLPLLPPAGVSAEDIQASRRFAAPILDGLRQGSFDALSTALEALGAVNAPPELQAVEQRARPVFQRWARYVMAAGSSKARARRLRMFRVYLAHALVLGEPVVRMAGRRRRTP